MQDSLEKLIRMVYKSWKSVSTKASQGHPDEETLACFLEGRLSEREMDGVRAHAALCSSCAEALAASLKAGESGQEEVPATLMKNVKAMLAFELEPSLLEIVLSLKEKALEILSTTGDVLVGQEFVPAPVLRSRSIREFKDEVNILKDFNDIRVEVKVENRQGNAFNLTVSVKHKLTHKVLKDLRVSLIKEDLELESYLTDSGSVTFEHVLLGRYRVEISRIDSKLASIVLDMKSS